MPHQPTNYPKLDPYLERLTEYHSIAFKVCKEVHIDILLVLVQVSLSETDSTDFA